MFWWHKKPTMLSALIFSISFQWQYLLCFGPAVIYEIVPETPRYPCQSPLEAADFHCLKSLPNISSIIQLCGIYSRAMFSPLVPQVSFLSMAEQVSANERGRYVCNVFSHWPRLCSARDRNRPRLWSQQKKWSLMYMNDSDNLIVCISVTAKPWPFGLFPGAVPPICYCAIVICDIMKRSAVPLKRGQFSRNSSQKVP